MNDNRRLFGFVLSAGIAGGTACDLDEPHVDIAVDCSFSFAGQQTNVTYEAIDSRTDTPVGGKLIATGALFDDKYEGRSFSVGHLRRRL